MKIKAVPRPSMSMKMVCKLSRLNLRSKCRLTFQAATTINQSVRARKAYYEMHNIGYCSRPAHSYQKKKWWQRSKTHPDNPDGFIRRGQFKKASNMNYCLDFSIRVEDELLRLISVLCNETGQSEDELSVVEENTLYQKALQTCIDQDEGRTIAGGNVRIGDLILIVDSDTRVVCIRSKLWLIHSNQSQPEDCLIFGALEMHESPEVAILQHASGVMQVADNVFENGSTYCSRPFC